MEIDETLFPRCKSVKRKSVKNNDENNDPSKDTEAAYTDIKETREDVPAPSAIISSNNIPEEDEEVNEGSRVNGDNGDGFPTSGSVSNKPPVAPPRARRGVAATKAAKAKLQDLHLAAESLELVANELINLGNSATVDAGQPGTPSTPFSPNNNNNTPNELKGNLHMLVVQAKGLRQAMKTRWFVYDKKSGKLKYYRSEQEEKANEFPLGQLDLSTATFNYDLERDVNGEFSIITRMGEHHLSAGSSDKRMYWLSQLQRARREFSQAGAAAVAKNATSCKVGLLKSESLDSPTKDSSPFKEIMQTLEKPPTEGGLPTRKAPGPPGRHLNSPPRSADYYNKGNKVFFFHHLGGGSRKGGSHFRLPRSSSMRTPSPPPGGGAAAAAASGANLATPHGGKPLNSSSTPGSFQALSKLRKSLRDKKSMSNASPSPVGSSGSFFFGGGGGATGNNPADQAGSPAKVASSPSKVLSKSKSIMGTSFMSSSGAPTSTAVCEDCQALRDEAQASKDVIAILRKQVEELEKAKETLTALQRPELDDCQLLEILRGKDSHIVGLESTLRDKQRESDLQEHEVTKLKAELKTYQDLFEAKDESIVRLTNKVHELELNQVVNSALQQACSSNTTSSSTSAPLAHCQAPGSAGIVPFSPRAPSSAKSTVPNGISFDSDRFEFREFVEVGVQTSPKGMLTGGSEITPSVDICGGGVDDSPADTNGSTTAGDDVLERLQDTVTAYEMQNRFLNKEVLELNQLRTQAVDREQKLFIEASDWEAKFYQIQSKYLLLLNELHNPQVGVSESRQEMVSQLLNDVLEAANARSGPLAVGKTPDKITTTVDGGSGGVVSSREVNYDRFGFRIEGTTVNSGNPESKSDDSNTKMLSRLWREAEEQLDVANDNLEELTCNSAAIPSSGECIEEKWNEAISALVKSKVPFAITNDVKDMLRLGIPISQRGAVWKAIVDHKLMRCGNDRFQTDYYKKLLANYNPSRKLTPAAKQIELDLLRTLPNNKHYEGPHADGIAKLRRVLLAYSVHNPDVEYCQGFNRIVAIALLFMHEEDAFWCLVFIIEHLMPPEYFSRDSQLIGAQVDQEVLKEMLSEKLPKLSAHFNSHGVDPTLFSLNWFLCIFVDTIPVKTYLHIWDAFLFEGTKVLFRYAIAIFKYFEDLLLKQCDYMSIFHTLRNGLEELKDIRKLTQIAFHDLNPFPMRTINHKREHHSKVLEAQKKELDHIRQNYRKNSLARTSSGAGGAGGGIPGGTTSKMPVTPEIVADNGMEDQEFAIPEETGGDESPKVQRIKVITRDTDTD